MSLLPITSEGYQKIQAELDQLKSVERPTVIKAIAAAREHGDLKENAEYHAAREKQSFIEGRIQDLEDRFARAQVIEVSKITDEKIRFGATVALFDVESEEEVSYKIVSEYEADLTNNLISITSPIAKGLIGKQEGDEVKIKTPKALREYEVINVEYK